MNIKLIVFLTVLFGGSFCFYQYNRLDLEKRNNLTEHVNIIAGSVELPIVDIERLKVRLTKYADSINGVRYIYIMEMMGDKVVFLVDTQPSSVGVDGLAQEGEVYEEADDVLKGLFEKEGRVVVGPESDKWGTFMSGMMSLVDANNRVVAVVGIDVDATKWNRDLWLSLVKNMLVITLIVFVEVILLTNLNKKNTSSQKLAYLASVLESSEDAIYSIDFDKKILSWNLGAEKLYGYTADEVLGKNMTSLLLPDDQVNILDDNLSKISLGRKLGTQETIRKTKSGKLITVSIILSPVYDETGKINSISVIARDITKQKQIDENLEKHNAELEKMNKLMLDRELIMMELKKKIKQYENK